MQCHNSAMGYEFAGLSVLGCSAVCYAIGTALSWVLAEVILPTSGFARGGAIVITLPVFMVLIGCCVQSILGKKDELHLVVGCGIIAGCISGVLDIVGIGLIIRALVDEPSAGAIVCGVFTVIFVLLAAVTNLVSCGLCAYHDHEHGRNDEN